MQKQGNAVARYDTSLRHLENKKSVRKVTSWDCLTSEANSQEREKQKLVAYTVEINNKMRFSQV